MSDYVSNKELLLALRERRIAINLALSNNQELPQVTDFICRCLQQICFRYSLNSNWIAYTFRDEMVAEAVYNCLKYVDKFEDNISSMKHTGCLSHIKFKDSKVIVGRTTGATASIKSYNPLTGRIHARPTNDIAFAQKEIALLDEEHEIQLDGITYSNPFAYFTQFARNSFLAKIREEEEQTIAKASIIQRMPLEYFDLQEQDGDEEFQNGMYDMSNNVYANYDIEAYETKRLNKKAKRVLPLEEFLE